MRQKLVVLVLTISLAGCASLVQKASDRFATNLGNAILDSEDPATVRDGLPAYLLLLDSLIEGQKPGDKSNAGTLMAAARLNSSYAGSFTGSDKAQAQALSAKALAYARRATCLEDAALCAALDQDDDHFLVAAKAVPAERVEGLYNLAATWAGFLQAHSEDWSAIADLPRVQALMSRVVEIDPGHNRGLPYVFLGVLDSLLPEAVGGKPEQGRAYFEKAITLSDGKNLYAKTLMAEYYARLVFNQELHDRLLNEVLAADPKAPGFTLMNVLAQQRAKLLLESGKDYF